LVDALIGHRFELPLGRLEPLRQVADDVDPDGTNTLVQVVARTVFFGTVLGFVLTRLGTPAAEA
jgi:hypothetical protein